MNFKLLSSIDVDKTQSWGQSIFLTLDIDWAHDEVLNDTIDLLESSGIKATWFATHDTKVLERLRVNQNFEIGIHPNFNPLLDGYFSKNKNAEEVLERILDIVPAAKSLRSHSMTQNSRLLDLFAEKGITHESNHFIPFHSRIRTRPWKLWNGLCRAPYCWEDDIHIMYSRIKINENNPLDIAETSGDGVLKVFDFHPIHIFLNTESMERYESTRSMHQDPKELIKQRFRGYGTRSRLIDLLKIGK